MSIVKHVYMAFLKEIFEEPINNYTKKRKISGKTSN